MTRQETAQTIPAVPGPYKIVAATGFGVFLSALDGSIVNVSLYTMSNDLGVSLSAIQWVVVAYLLVLTSGMPLMGKFGDRFGKTKIFQFGMLVFIIGSLACAFSTTLAMLVGARVFQAIGSSMITANGLALVTYYTTPQNRGRAIGLNSVILAAALGLGPVLGGILSEFFGWESIFLINLPIGLLGFITVAKIIPETEKVVEVEFDTIGAVLFFTFLFSAVYYVSVATTSSMLEAIFWIALFTVTFIGFIYRERIFCSPIIPTGVLADRRISTSIFSALLAYMAIVPVSFLIPFFLQEALGFSQSITGIILTAHPLVISVSGPLSGYVSERVKAKRQTVIGLIVELFGLFFIAIVTPDIPLMILGVVFMGFGLSLFTVANGNFIMTSAPRQYMGVVSALTNISRTTGFSVATAIVTTVFFWYFDIFNTSGATNGPLYIDAYITAVQYTIWTFCLFAIIGAIISVFRGLSPAEEGGAPPFDQVCDPEDTPTLVSSDVEDVSDE